MDEIAAQESAHENACYETAVRNGFTAEIAHICEDGDVGCQDCPFNSGRIANPPKATEIIYTWPDGREEVRYRRPYGSDMAHELVMEVKKLHLRHGVDASPYSIKHN